MRWRNRKDITETDSGSVEGGGRRGEEICQEIRDVLEGRKDVNAIHTPGVLSPKLEKLVALSSVLATQQDSDVVTTAVNACLEAEATPREIMHVLDQAILMAEIPALAYRAAVRKAIDAFHTR